MRVSTSTNHRSDHTRKRTRLAIVDQECFKIFNDNITSNLFRVILFTHLVGTGGYSPHKAFGWTPMLRPRIICSAH